MKAFSALVLLSMFAVVAYGYPIFDHKDLLTFKPSEALQHSSFSMGSEVYRPTFGIRDEEYEAKRENCSRTTQLRMDFHDALAKAISLDTGDDQTKLGWNMATVQDKFYGPNQASGHLNWVNQFKSWLAGVLVKAALYKPDVVKHLRDAEKIVETWETLAKACKLAGIIF